MTDIDNILATLPEQSDLPELPEGHQGAINGPEFDLLKLATSTGRKCEDESGWTIGETNEPVDKGSLWAIDMTKFEWGYFGFGEDRSKGPTAKWVHFLSQLPENPDPDICRLGYRVVLTCVRGAHAGKTAEYAATNSGMNQVGKLLAQKTYEKIREAKELVRRDPNQKDWVKVNPVVRLDHGEFQAKKGPGKGKWFLKPVMQLTHFTDRFLSDYPEVASVQKPEAIAAESQDRDEKPTGRRKAPN